MVSIQSQSSVCWGPDGAFALADNGCQIVCHVGGKQFSIQHHSDGRPVRMAWGRDGELAVVSGSTLIVLQTRGLAPGDAPCKTTRTEFADCIRHFSWGSDGWLLVVHRVQDILQHASGKCRTLPSTAFGWTWSPDGNALAACDHDGIIIQLPHINELRISLPKSAPQSLSWSSTGAYIAVGAGDATFLLCTRRWVSVCGFETSSVSWGPGDILAYNDRNQNVCTFDMGSRMHIVHSSRSGRLVGWVDMSLVVARCDNMALVLYNVVTGITRATCYKQIVWLNQTYVLIDMNGVRVLHDGTNALEVPSDTIDACGEWLVRHDGSTTTVEPIVRS